MKKWTVYRTINRVNNRYYIGVHATENPNDSYFGSGKIIKAILKRYGAEDLYKEILHCFSNSEDAFSKEKEILLSLIGHDPLCMNICEGGGNPPSHKGRKLRPEEIEARRFKALGNKNSLGKKHRPGALTGKVVTEKVLHGREKTRQALIGRKPSQQCIEASINRDLSFMKTPEYKAKMSTVKKGKKQSSEWIAKRVASWRKSQGYVQA